MLVRERAIVLLGWSRTEGSERKKKRVRSCYGSGRVVIWIMLSTGLFCVRVERGMSFDASSGGTTTANLLHLSSTTGSAEPTNVEDAKTQILALRKQVRVSVCPCCASACVQCVRDSERMRDVRMNLLAAHGQHDWKQCDNERGRRGVCAFFV